MKKGWKIFWIATGVIAVLGLVSTFGALVTGISIYDVFREVETVELVEEKVENYAQDFVPGQEWGDEYSDVRELVIESNGCKVMVQTDHKDTVRVDTSTLKHDKAECVVEYVDGTLVVQAFRQHGHHCGVIKITVPEGTAFDGIEIRAEAGEIVLDGVNTYLLNITAEAGEVEFSGEVNGDVAVECSAGEVELLLDGTEEEYNYQLDCETGELEIGAFEIEGLTTEKRIDNHAEHTVDICCEVGSVSVGFR